MTTKATMELIEWAKAMADRIGDDGYWNLALEAKQEQQAIQRAAKNLVEIWGHAGDGNPAEVLIRKIAKEAR